MPPGLISTMCMPGFYGCKNRVLQSVELDLWMFESCHVDAKNWTQIFWRISSSQKYLEIVLSMFYFFFLTLVCVSMPMDIHVSKCFYWNYQSNSDGLQNIHPAFLCSLRKDLSVGCDNFQLGYPGYWRS